ncbi:MAG: YggT family protein [Cryobacterium sp.]|nr:YggT family protein [Micrococcales bacterium]MBX3310850.1 YggT family protein [Cryobacterium sp.]MCB1282270.1 YggT family protein [Salinibacterium sp.]HNP16721.1 YggT family protein [Terrimesophilobacter sp.]
MLIVSAIAGVLYFLLLAYFFVMWARFIVDLAQNFSRTWRPRGFGLVLAEIVYTLTDPPIRAVRKVVPPFRVGPAALDFSWSIVMLVVIVLMYIALALSSV